MDYIIQNDYQPFQNDLQKLPHTKKTYQANDEILLTNRSYFVVTGRVVEILLLEDGNEHALVAYGPQTMFPPLFSASIAAQDELRYDVIQPTTLWVYDNDSLFNYAQTHSAFSKQLHQSALKHMDYYLNDISQLLSESGMQRLITFLLYYLNEHHPADQLIPIRQKNLAALIAVNPTNMSRNVKKLKDANIIMVSSDGVTVLNLEALKAYN